MSSAKSIVGLALTVFLLAACQSGICYIKGEARQYVDGTLLYLADEQGETLLPTDSFIVTNGVFCYESPATDSLRLCRLYPKDVPWNGITFFLEPGNIYIELSQKQAASRVSGTKSNNEWQALNDTVLKYDRQIRQLIGHPADSISLKKLSGEADRLYSTLTQRINETAVRNKCNALGRFIAIHFAGD